MEITTEQQFVNRSRMDIIASLISHSIDGAGPTKLIYRCNLNHSQFKKYSDYLVIEGFLEKKTKLNGRIYRETYQATGKGIEFLNDYKRFSESLDALKEKKLFSRPGIRQK